MLLLLAAGALTGLVMVALVNALPLWLVAQHGLPPDAAVIGVSLAALFAGAGLGRLAAVAVANRIGTSRVVEHADPAQRLRGGERSCG
ncbi:hypothetical protein [Pseudonocardia nigra]|uniref:hypothetical protein n=1 Tax=Pseudonocardia nigra TaxID=1921578 RepID=UPI001C5EE596|nr:hypothetical protein [Pseudonocardia nigra]